MLEQALATAVRIICGVPAQPADERHPPGRCIYFANHTSHLDFLLLWAVLPPAQRRRTRPVAGRDYWEKGPIRRFLANRVFRAILIERQKVTAATNPLTPMIEALESGAALIVFPEGTRSPDGEVHEFKGGLYHLAKAHPETALVPVYLENLNRVLPKGEFLLVPLVASIRFGPPVRLEENQTKPAFLTRARDAVLALRSS
jgi:1-acyl-sn-glycerol-3-phosphate acyltransferase